MAPSKFEPRHKFTKNLDDIDKALLAKGEPKKITR